MSLLLVILVVWLLASLKTSRFDGVLVQPLHPYRRLMAFVMDKKTEAVVYFDSSIDAEPLLRYVEEATQSFKVDVTHCLVAAGFIGLHQVPSMNRFVVGRRLYQRQVAEISFSMKRKRLDRAAKIANLKVRLEPGETFRAMCERLQSDIYAGRSDQVTREDREYNLFGQLPRPLLAASVAIIKWLDYYNLAPRALIEPDALYTSIYCANLGSLGMAPGYHHLYEWGNCPIFMMVGSIEERAVVSDGQLVRRRVLPIRWSYDERIDDGLNAGLGINAVLRALENPYESLGCLRPDGSDSKPLLS